MKTILTWHLHHEFLVEPCYSIRERREVIKEKPKSEVALRLKLFKPVKSKELPSGVKCVLERIRKTERRLSVLRALRMFMPNWLKMRTNIWTEIGTCHEQHRQQVHKLWDEIERCHKFFTQLHKTECPNCPWDGDTIFPNDASYAQKYC